MYEFRKSNYSRPKLILRRLKHLIALACLVSTSLLAISGIHPASAQDYPTKTIKIVVPFPAGGPTDVAARLIAQALSSRIGASVVVDNLSGAGGRIGTKFVAKAAPDGYTLLLGGTNVNGLVGALYHDLDFDPIKSFTPVAALCIDSMAMVVGPNVPVNTFAEFLTYAKANPGKLRFGAPTGIYTHIVGEYVKISTGTDLMFVPYRGGAPAITDALGGHIEVVFNTKATLLSYVKEGKLKALVVTSSNRWPELPEIPTLKEVGLSGFPTEILFGLLAPAGTPPAIVEKLNRAINEGMKSQEFQNSVAKLGMDVKFGSPADFDAALKEQVVAWKTIVDVTGIKAE